MKLAIAVMASAMAFVPLTVIAQNGPGCSSRCSTQFLVCQTAAGSELEECLDRATTQHEKIACATAFTKLEDACRETESACLSNCPTS